MFSKPISFKDLYDVIINNSNNQVLKEKDRFNE